MIRVIAFILVFTTHAYAVDVTMAWTASDGATGYKVRMSVDGGHRWDIERDTESTDTTYTWVGAPEDRLLLFKVAAYNATDLKYNNYGGCWYDYRLKVSVIGYPAVGVKDVEGTVAWDAVTGATNYYMDYSINKNVSYPTEIPTGNVTEFKWASIPTDRLVFIKGCSVVNGSKVCRPWAGAWYYKRYQYEYGGHLYWQFFN